MSVFWPSPNDVFHPRRYDQYSQSCKPSLRAMLVWFDVCRFVRAFWRGFSISLSCSRSFFFLLNKANCRIFVRSIWATPWTSTLKRSLPCLNGMEGNYEASPMLAIPKWQNNSGSTRSNTWSISSKSRLVTDRYRVNRWIQNDWIPFVQRTRQETLVHLRTEPDR